MVSVWSIFQLPTSWAGPIAAYESAVITQALRMRDKSSSSEAAWQEEELSAAALPDKRLARRLRRLLDQMSAAPGKPIPAACGDWAAAYRFFDNPRVTAVPVMLVLNGWSCISLTAI